MSNNALARRDQWKVSKGHDGAALYINPSAYKNGALMVLPPNQPRVHFKAQNGQVTFQYKGPEDSPITGQALDLAADILSSRR